MTYVDICAHLLTDSESPFNSAVWSNISVLGIFSDFGSIIAYGIGYLFKIILDGMNDFAIQAYKFLSFSNASIISGEIDSATGEKTVKGLYDVLTEHIWIPLLICGLIVCLRVIFGERSVGKQFIRNMGYVMLAVVIMPSVFSFMNNNVITEDYFTNTTGSNPLKENSLADNILRNNSSDRVWLYYYAAENIGSPFTTLEENTLTMYKSSWDPLRSIKQLAFPEDAMQDAVKDAYGNMLDEDTGISEVVLQTYYQKLNSAEVNQEWINDKNSSSHLTFDNMFSTYEKVTEHIKNDWSDSYADTSGKYIDGVPNLFKLKAVEITQATDSGTETHYVVQRMSDGSNLSDVLQGNLVGHESYWRYNVNWLSTYIELLAHAYVFFVVGYCAMKLIIELIVHQVFGGIMAAMDLNGGDRIKKYFSAIIGCYAGLLICAMVIPLYSAGCYYISHDMNIDSGFVRAMLKIVLAMVIINVPNIISMYFGINTGSRAGAIMFGAGVAAAWKVGKTAARVGVNSARGVRNLAQDGYLTERGYRHGRDKLQEARAQSSRAERAEAAQHAQEREQLSDQRYASNQAQNAAQAQHAQEREQLSNQHNERQGLSSSGNEGLTNISDEAHGRGTNVTPDSENQRQESLSNIAAEAEQNGGTRQAYLEAAGQELQRNGAINPTSETTSLAADSAKYQHELQSYSKANAVPTSYQSAQQHAEQAVLSDWGGSKQNVETIKTHNQKAAELPARNDNDNLGTGNRRSTGSGA